MKTVLIGFVINIGTFKDDNGKDVPYSNRIITFISNTGENKTRKGFFPFEQKFKLVELADILGVQPDDRIINEALMTMVNKAIKVDFAAVGGQLKIVNFELEQK
jgi:hypothetical protein